MRLPSVVRELRSRNTIFPFPLSALLVLSEAEGRSGARGPALSVVERVRWYLHQLHGVTEG